MIYKLNTSMIPLFSGTYETDWDVREIDDDGNELPACYDHTELLKGIAREYGNHVQFIKEELNVPWIKSIKFTGKVYSPREYNFATDSLDFNLKVNKWEMRKYLKSLKDNTEYAEYLRENYQSRDGFWSYTPCTWQETWQAITGHGEHEDQAVSALVRWSALQSDPDIFEYMGGLEGAIHDQWSSNGYQGLDWWVECGECNAKMEYDMDGEWHCPNTH